jgi:chemotaxis protein methyltransferase CheR
MSAFEFEQLRTLFNDVAGLHFDASAKPLFERRLAARLPVHETSDYRDYLRILQAGPHAHSEVSAALDLLTSGETYFFRHKRQLSVLEHTVFPTVAESNRGSRRVTIWSAGCSSGEEAYTCAIMALESPCFARWKVQVIGSDLSAERIEHARQGCYFAGAFRSTDSRVRKRYFSEAGKLWQINSATQQLCHFRQLNLLDPNISSLVGRVDIILCRNVLIYLDEEARNCVLGNLYERLNPGGFLLLGHSESLKFLHTPLDLIGLEQDLAYRRPELTRARGGLR